MWQTYFKYTALINLKKRPDRLLQSSDILNEFGANYEVWEATDNLERPCEGLVDSMQRYFKKVFKEGGERCLIFEDDIMNLTSGVIFNDVMNKCVEQLPDDWDILYLGCNPASGLQRFHSDNLLPVALAYSTHACAYSKRAMEFIAYRNIQEPVDNYLVREFQPYAKCFVTYPMLMTQRPGYSDIGKEYTDWSLYLEQRYANEVIRPLTDKYKQNKG